MKPNTMFSIQLYLLFLALAFSMSSSFRWPIGLRRYHVRIQNNLPKVLDLHCKSKDDDLGVHHVQPSQEYEFTFKINYFASTLFFCDFWSDNHHAAFDVFRAENDFVIKGCGGEICTWKGQDDGFYLLNKGTNAWKFMNKWDKK